MSAIGGRAPPWQKRRSFTQDLLDLAQFADFALQRFDALALFRRRVGPRASAALGLLHAIAQGPPEQPILDATDRMAAYRELCSRWCSCTIRTAGSRLWMENGGVRFVMASISQDQEPPENPGRFGPVDRNEQVKFALRGPDLGDVDVEKADWTALERLLVGLVAVDIRRAADPVTPKAAGQR